LAERRHRVLASARLLAVEGTLERDGAVVHVLAHRLADLSTLLGRLNRGRDSNVKLDSRVFSA
jgi:error-prone DNA polymerase